MGLTFCQIVVPAIGKNKLTQARIVKLKPALEYLTTTPSEYAHVLTFMECADRFAGKGFSTGYGGVTAMPAIPSEHAHILTFMECADRFVGKGFSAGDGGVTAMYARHTSTHTL